MKETFSEFIHNNRILKGLTLTKLAAALDIDQSTLSKIENNKREFKIENLSKLAEILDLNLDELEKEFLSEKIALLMYPKENTSETLKLAEEKIKYFKENNLSQGKLMFNNE